MLFSPFEQFEIQFYLNQWFSYNLTDTIILLLCLLIFLQFVYANFIFNRTDATIYMFNIWYDIFFFTYYVVDNVLYGYAKKKWELVFPFYCYIFFFITFTNLIGLFPFSITLNAHLNICFSISITVWLGILYVGLVNFGMSNFVSFFFPHGIPFYLLPLLSTVELISFIFRSVSLALRLFANLVAGHILLDTLAVSVFNIMKPLLSGIKLTFVSIIPMLLCFVLLCFEFVVALLQGLIFIMLSSLYFKDIYLMD